MLERIQSLFERFVGVPVYPCQRTLPMPSRLPENLQRPACWRRSKRVSK